jgi:hypothetical protein
MWQKFLTISHSAPAGGDEFNLFGRAGKGFDPVQTGWPREAVENHVS